MKTLAIGWVYVLRILREPASLFFFFVFPVAMVFIIGIQFGGQGGRVQLGVSGDTSQLITDRITGTLAGNQALNLVFYEDKAEMLTAVERGVISAGVVFPPEMAARAAVGQPVLIGFLAAPTGLGPQLEATVQHAVTEEMMPYRAARFAVDLLGVGFQDTWPLANQLVDQVKAHHRHPGVGGRVTLPTRHGAFRRRRRLQPGAVHVPDRPHRRHRHGRPTERWASTPG